MNCKECGTQIRREHKREDGKYECPGCGKTYRVKQNPSAAAPAAKAPAGKKTAKKPVRRNAVIAAAAAIALALVLILVLPGGQDKIKAPEATPEPTATPVPTPSPTPVPEPASVHFRAVGDVMSHKLQLTHAKQPDGSYNYDSQFMYVKDSLSRADYTIANLELSIAVDEEYSSYPRFKTPEAILDTLKDCGVDFLTMSNNHILDAFYDGLKKTVDEAEERGFDHVGAYRTAEESRQPVVVDINGIRFGFLAYTTYLNENERRLDSETRAFCVKRLQEADFEADVKQLRDAGAEVVICLPHWGLEGKRKVAEECRTYAEQMVNAGVDIILGSHPHVVLPVDVGELDVNGEKKDILISWSLGNFISYMAAQYMDSGIILDFTVSRDAEGKISIHDVGYVPVYVWGNKEDFHLICSGDYYDDAPRGMSVYDHYRMKESVGEITKMVGKEGIELLQN